MKQSLYGMHELSLSYATVETVLEAVAHLSPRRVVSVTLTAGELSGVALEAFRFSFPIATAGTILHGCELHIDVEPVTVFCPQCQATKPLATIQQFRCPDCLTPTADVRTGRHFVIQSIEIDTDEDPPA